MTAGCPPYWSRPEGMDSELPDYVCLRPFRVLHGDSPPTWNAVLAPGTSPMLSRPHGRPSGGGTAPRRRADCISTSGGGMGSHAALGGCGAYVGAVGLQAGRELMHDDRSCSAQAEEEIIVFMAGGAVSLTGMVAPRVPNKDTVQGRIVVGLGPSKRAQGARL